MNSFEKKLIKWAPCVLLRSSVAILGESENSLEWSKVKCCSSILIKFSITRKQTRTNVEMRLAEKLDPWKYRSMAGKLET